MTVSTLLFSNLNYTIFIIISPLHGPLVYSPLLALLDQLEKY